MAITGIPQASLFLGIIPALVLLFISLKGYEGYYKDKTIFITFIFGIILGFIAALIEIVSLGIGPIFIILFPLIEQLSKTIVLNLRRLHAKRETVIYGLSLGLGFGAIFTPVSLLSVSSQIQADITQMILTFIGSVGMILIHAATGVIIGYGVYIEKLSKYFIFALLLHIPVTLWVFVTGVYTVEYLQLILIIYGIIIYWYATMKIMPKILKENQPRKRSNIKTTN